MPIQKTLHAKTPVHIWTNDLEREAQSQLERLASLPILFHHVAVMPDVHAGLGSTVGTVLATRGSIIPACVGVDIGCGMMAVQTNLKAEDLEGRLSLLRLEIENAIPVGFDQNKNSSSQIHALELWKSWNHLHPKINDDDRLRKKALLQCGSLGGGNHFIEVCLDRKNSVWLLLHSGSRHIGKVLADVHIHSAKGVMKKTMTSLPDQNLAYLTERSEEFDSYIHDLTWAQSYAFQNREEMMQRLVHILRSHFGDRLQIQQKINCHHNYAQREKHFGKDIWVTRKGAVSAREGEWGIIPGSMGAKSYIVQGLGCEDSFMSCSHGAGRRMSRTQAKKIFSKNDLEAQTRGVECRKDKGVLDEIPSAYKNIEDVMRDQSDLVSVKATLKQVICVKG